MMKVKIFISYITITLCLVMGNMSWISHHHHDGIICMTLHHINHSQHSGNCKNEIKSCCSTSINAYRKQDKMQIPKIKNNEAKTYSALHIHFCNKNKKCGHKSPYIEKLHDKSIYVHKGLRSPPSLS